MDAILLYDIVVMMVLKNLLMAIAGILAIGFVLYLTPISAQNLAGNKTDTTGFSQNNSIRNLENPALKIEKNPLANLSNPLENLTNPLANLSNPLENLTNPLANLTK
jgi:hypothetical protein